MKPITLLNSDYKVIEKVLANRIKPTLDHLIHNDQKGFMKDRRISANIRKVLDLVERLDNQEGLILSVDFRKCFDMIEFEAIFKSLEFFGFGANMVKWSRTLYKNFMVCVQNNGFFSNKINIE